MSLDLILKRDCSPREKLSDAALVEASHLLKFHTALHGACAAYPGSVAPPGDDTTFETEGPVGPIQGVTRLGDVRTSLRAVWTKLIDCIGCPLNVTGSPIGCHVSLPYPVEPAVELLVADAASKASSDASVAEALLSRTPVTTPGFRRPAARMFSSAYPPQLQIRFEERVQGVSLDAFWDLLLAPRSPADGYAVMAVLTALQEALQGSSDDPPSGVSSLLMLGYALRVWASAPDASGYLVTG
ncbi:MAG: hypothetical protein U0166_06590 [Acidobacteriota bacterium]